jgi:hypothetical protein
MKKILVILSCFFVLHVSAQDQTSNDNEANDISFGVGDPDGYDSETQVPIDDYVPFLVAGVVVYGVCMNKKKQTVQA